MLGGGQGGVVLHWGLLLPSSACFRQWGAGAALAVCVHVSYPPVNALGAVGLAGLV